MRIVLAAAATVCLLSPLAASAEDAPAPAQPAAVQQSQTVICHYYVHEGMVLRRPDCRTADEWRRHRIDEQRFIREEYQQKGLLQVP